MMHLLEHRQVDDPKNAREDADHPSMRVERLAESHFARTQWGARLGGRGAAVAVAIASAALARRGEALVERCALGRDGHFRRRQRLYGWQLRQRCRGVRGSPMVRQFLQAFLHHEPSLGRAVGALWLARDGTRLSSAVPTLSSASRPSTERRRAIAHHDASRRQRSQRRATEAAAAIATAVRSALVRATPDVGRQ